MSNLAPICKIIIYREDGCDSVRCKNCKVKFCWNCSKTNSEIEIMDKHDCDDFDGYIQ
jgi:hypothetical protein